MTVPFTLGTEQVIAKFLVSSKNPAKEPRLRAGVKVCLEGEGGSHEISPTTHTFAVGLTPFPGKDMILMVDKES